MYPFLALFLQKIYHPLPEYKVWRILPSHGELEPGPGGSRHRLLLGLATVLASLAARHFHGSRIRIVLLVTVGR